MSFKDYLVEQFSSSDKTEKFKMILTKACEDRTFTFKVAKKEFSENYGYCLEDVETCMFSLGFSKQNYKVSEDYFGKMYIVRFSLFINII